MKLEKTFKTDDYIFLLLEYINGIDFFDVLREIGLCKISTSRFYFGCFLLAIEELHSRNIVYRDLKPENAVVDTEGYLYMIDLGTAKELAEENGYRTFTIIGSQFFI